MARSDWVALLAAAVHLAYRHDTRPSSLVKGLACQTRGEPGDEAISTMHWHK